PPATIVVGDLAGSARRVRRAAGPRRSLFYPLRQRRDLIVRQLGPRRHSQVVAVMYRLDEQTLVGRARHDDRAGVAALEQSRGRIERQTAFFLALRLAV